MRDVGDPVAQRLVDGVLEGGAAVVDGHHLGAEDLHPGHVERLALGVDPAHVDRAVQTHEGGRGGGGDAVLAGTGLGDDPGLAHPLGEQRLGEDVVDLVRAGVVEVLALEDDARPTAVRGEPRHLGDDARPAGVGAVQPGELVLELGVDRGLLARLVELLERRDQRLGHVAPTERRRTAPGAAAPRGRGRGSSVPSGAVARQATEVLGVLLGVGVAPAATIAPAAGARVAGAHERLADEHGVGALLGVGGGVGGRRRCRTRRR